MTRKISERAISSQLGGTPRNSTPRPTTRSHRQTRLIAERREARDEFAGEQRVPVDRLGENAREGAPVVLAVDGIEAEADRHQRNEEAENADEGRQRRPVDGEQLEQQERIFRRGVAQAGDRAVERRRRGEQHQPFEHAHARAAEMVGELLEHDRAEALPGRALTLHRATPSSRNARRSGCRWRRGSGRRPRAGSARRRRRPRRAPRPAGRRDRRSCGSGCRRCAPPS